jgi:uncharacterized protein YndB with AHSA1/START domain
MLIRSPASAVFDAFVQPAMLKKSWLRRVSGPLVDGAKVRWEFRVPGATEMVEVTRFVQGEHISFAWSGGITVALGFRAKGRFSMTEGFAIVLYDLKCLLETGKSGGMVRDKAALTESPNA